MVSSPPLYRWEDGGVGRPRAPQSAWPCGDCPCGLWLPAEPPPTAQSAGRSRPQRPPCALPPGKRRIWPLEPAPREAHSEALAAPGSQPTPRQPHSSCWFPGPGQQAPTHLGFPGPAGQWSSWPGSGCWWPQPGTRFCPAAAAASAGGPRPVGAGQGKREITPSHEEGPRSPPEAAPTAHSSARQTGSLLALLCAWPRHSPQSPGQGRGPRTGWEDESLTPMSGPVRDQ